MDKTYNTKKSELVEESVPGLTLADTVALFAREDKKQLTIKSGKKSASDIEALRWREIFQASLMGLSSRASGRNHDNSDVVRAADMADKGLEEFYSRYEREK